MRAHFPHPRALFALVVAVGLLAPRPSRADDEEDARRAFVMGSERVKEARWAEALEAYELSAAKRPHPVTTLNLGVCERALGHGTRAERKLLEALEAEAKTPHVLPEPVRRDAEAFLAETRATLVEIDIELSPGDAGMLVDGRPLESSGLAENGIATRVAGLALPGRSDPIDARTGKTTRFRLRVDSGTHVLVLSRPGFADVVRRATWAPGTRAHGTEGLVLSLDRLPGRLVVTSAPLGGVVTLDGLDVGEAPVALERAAGAHHVRVRKPGFLPYEIDVVLGAGQTTSLDAKLRVETPSVLGRWWFWGGVASVVAGAAVVTYFAARPAPEVPPANGGGLGWVVSVP